jgi:DNA-binding NtrC family response regulator
MKTDINILIVEDDAPVCSILEQVLKTEGYVIHCAESSPAAMEYIRLNHVDLVISDIRMPEMDGFELLHDIKKLYPQIAVILMIGFGDAGSVHRALRLGADEYITKPFRNQELLLIVERVCWRSLSGKNPIQSALPGE